MKNESLDYDAKIFAPTKELYQQLSQQATEVYDQVAISANELHVKIAETSLEFYEHPSETASRWQAELTDKSNELYAFVNNEVIPVAKADYQLLVSVATDYGVQTRDSVQFFIDNPRLVTVDAFTAMNQSLMQFFEASVDISAQALENIGAQANEIIGFLSDDPLQGIENLYYDSLSLLLNGYFDMVSSVLVSAPF